MKLTKRVYCERKIVIGLKNSFVLFIFYFYNFSVFVLCILSTLPSFLFLLIYIVFKQLSSIPVEKKNSN